MEYLVQLKSIIQELIDLKKEGVFWDYKYEHHNKSIDLIHDTTCLANTQHNSDRYIIFGVSDDGDIVGLETLKKQADIIDTLRNSKYADNTFPDVRLETITLSEKRVQVLIIKNRPQKPYYLSSDNKNLRAGTVYTRTMDTNTPKNSVASSKDIEYMWKERFGLIESPLDRLKIYLQDFNGWGNQDEIYFYRQQPEFTIKPLDSNYCKGAEKNEWARGEIGYHYDTGNTTYIYGLFYHTTLMQTICCVIFDGGKKTIVNPEWEPIGKGRIYYYLTDNLKYIFQKFLAKQHKTDYSENISSTNYKSFNLPLFSNIDELERFLVVIKKELNFGDKDSSLVPEHDEIEQNNLFNSYIKYYIKWKKNEL